jgi:hypothetical protein
MRRNGAGDIRARNGFGNYLDELGNVATPGQYSVDLLFVIPVSAASGTGQERQVRIELDGAHRLLLEGGLTEQLIGSPESINWGLGEIALVSIGQDGDRVGIEVLWEGDRKIEATSQGVTIVEL